MKPEPEAYRFDFDGYGWSYRDSGSGSSWKDKRVKDKEFMYTEAQMRQAIEDALEKAAQFENEDCICSKHDMADAIRYMKEHI